MQRLPNVVCGERRVAEPVSRRVMQRRQPDQQARAAGRRNQSARACRGRAHRSSQHPNNAGATIPVSFTSTRTAQTMADARKRFCRKSSSASIERHMAGISSCASIDCAKNSGERHSSDESREGGRAGGAARQFDPEQKRRRARPARRSAASRSGWPRWNSRRSTTTPRDKPSRPADERWEQSRLGIHAPVRNRSSDAGMNCPVSSQ